MQSRPENFCKRWSPAELAQVLSKSATGVPIKAIAEQHGRTTGGIRSRLMLAAFAFVSQGKTVSEAARLTGLNASQIIAQIQMSEKTDSVSAAPVPSPKMQFSTTLSRADLQAIPAKLRLETIRRYIDNHLGQNVQHASALGQTSYLFVIPPPERMRHANEYVVTPNDIVEGLKVKYPGCDVEFSEEWVETRPGVREQRSGIRIDWS